MPDQSQSGRLKSQTPPMGVSVPRPPRKSAMWPLQAIGVGLVVALAGLGAVHWLLRGAPSVLPASRPAPQIEVPAPANDPNAALPHASASRPVIGSIASLAKPWSSQSFFYLDSRTGESVPALLIRLPIGSLSQASGYWAFALTAPSDKCSLEYLANLKKLKSDYGFLGATHPMIGNPCTRTVFDPLKIMNLPGGVWARGAIVQGSDLRPPLAIEVEVAGKEIRAIRME